jgi:hypothetical protein
MNTIKLITFRQIDDPILVKVRAGNAGGWGDYSVGNTGGATIEGVPDPSSNTVNSKQSSNIFESGMTSNRPEDDNSKYMLIIYIGAPILLLIIVVVVIICCFRRKSPPTMMINNSQIEASVRSDKSLDNTVNQNNSIRYNDMVGGFGETQNPYMNSTHNMDNTSFSYLK